MRVSVVINTFNRAPYLVAALHSLARQRTPPYQVIVVNGPSSDDTEAVVAASPGVTYLRTEQRNLSVSRNIGLRAADGDVVAFLDDDAIAEPGWTEALAAGYGDGIWAVGGFILDHTGMAYQCRYTLCDLFGDSYSSWQLPAGSGVADLRAPGRYVGLTGANCSFDRRRLCELGGFDEFYAYFLEETDVCLRMWRAGGRVRISAAALVHHRFAPSHLRDVRRIPTSQRVNFRSKGYFIARHARPVVGDAAVRAYATRLQTAERAFKYGMFTAGHITAEHRDRLLEDAMLGLEQGLAAGEAAGKLAPQPAAAVAQARARRPPALRGRALRIAFVSREYGGTADGGIGVWTRHLAEGLAGRGHEVSVVAQLGPGDGAARVDVASGVWVHRVADARHPVLPPQGGPDQGGPPALPTVVQERANAVQAEVLRLAIQRQVDIVSAPIWDVEGIMLAGLSGIRTITSLHTTYGLALPSKPVWQADKLYLQRHVQPVIAAEEWLLRHGDVVVSNSAQIERDLGLGRLRHAGPRIYHGLPDVPPQPRPARAVPHILFVGRCEPRKGVATLFEALALLDGRGARFTLGCVGDLFERDPASPIHALRIRHGADAWFQAVRFEGPVDDARLRAAYAEADILVVPSRYESFGLTAVEGFRAGAAVVGTDAGGLGEVLRHAHPAGIVPVDDAPALAEALARLAADPALRAEVAAAGRAAYLAQFTLDAMLDRWEALFHDLSLEARPAMTLRAG